ncbi:MAG: response regulator transcription factor [Helicobacter sp.]|nr:response regulator transcription factor [Helicobacter sp.]
MYKILLVEDDLEMQKLLSVYLQQSQMEVIATKSPLEALKILENTKGIHLAVLDIMLPEMDGFELCQKIRALSDIPIIMSSARNDINSKMMGFDRGADDYLAKSYEPLELVMRINALLKRYGIKENLVYKNLVVDTKKRKVTLDKELLDLTPTEFEILLLLLTHKGKPHSREVLAQAIASIAPDSSLRSIDTHIRNLRFKLKDNSKEPQFIQSVWGIGYKFCE